MSALMKKQNGALQLQTVSWSSNNHASIDGYQILATAILKLAAEDYKKELIKSKKGNLKTRECHQLERFFRSDWYEMLSDLDGEFLMAGVRRMVRLEVAA